MGQPLHRARFASLEELWPLLMPELPQDGVLLGTKRFLLSKRFAAVRKTKQHRELGHTLVVGRTGSGKGLLAVSQLLTWHHSAIVNDIKGDLFAQTAGFRSLLGPVYVLDPSGVGHAYDPLSGKTTQDDLLVSATQLMRQAEDNIFNMRAAKMLARIFTAARLREVEPLPYARTVFSMGLRGCAEELNTVSPPLARGFLESDLEHSRLEADNFLMSCWGTLTTLMEPLTTETVIRSLARSDFTPEEIITSPKPVTVYVRWPEDQLEALAPLVRLIWGSLVSGMMRAHDRRAGKDCQPVMLLVDEGGRTAIPSLAEHITTIRSRDLVLLLAVQSLSQLETVYGKARAQTLRDNMETQLYYRPTDYATAHYLEQRLGRRSAYARSTTERQDGQGSESQSEQAIPLLTAQDVQRLKDDEVIGFHRALSPFRLKRMDWRQHPILEKRRSAAAPTVPELAALADLPVLQAAEQFHYISPNR